LRLLLALLLCPLAWAAPGDAAAEKQFREEVAGKAGADDAAAAKALMDLWRANESKIAPLRKDVGRIRAKRVKEEQKLRKERDQRKRAAIRTRISELVDDYIKVDRRLSPLELRRAVLLDAIGGMQSAESVRWFCTEGLGRTKNPVLRRAIGELAVRSKDIDSATMRAALAQSKKAELVVPLLHALGRDGGAYDETVLEVVLGFLGHKDWAVRVAAAHALAAMADPSGVEPVLVALKRAPKRSREQHELAAALTRFTGQSLGAYPDLWQKWWDAEKLNVLAGRVPLGKGAAGRGSKSDQGRFYGIPQTAERIIYVVDISGSMDVSMLNPEWIDGEPVPAREDEDSRYDAALRELLRATRKLRPRSTFAVFVYSSKSRGLHGKMMPATKENVSKLELEFAHVGPEGSTNIYEALEQALRFAGVYGGGTTGKRKQVADAIYLLSDGAPTDAKGKNEDPRRTLIAVREWNALKRIAIHTIGIGKQHSRAFLEQLATENGGQYYGVGNEKKKRKRRK